MSGCPADHFPVHMMQKAGEGFNTKDGGVLLEGICAIVHSGCLVKTDPHCFHRHPCCAVCCREEQGRTWGHETCEPCEVYSGDEYTEESESCESVHGIEEDIMII